MSDRSIRRIRRQENYHPVHSKIHWTNNLTQAARRFQFASTHLSDDWHNVIFTDEKKFAIDQSGRVFWIPIGSARPKTFISQVKFHINVFGAIWYNGRSDLVLIRGRTNSSTYLEHVETVLNSYLRKVRDYFLIHDRTTWSHTNIVHTWLNNNRITCMDDYPSVSPELNAIESVWGWMNKYVQSKQIKTQLQMERFVQEAWERIPIAVIRGYIDNISKITQKIFSVDGWDIDE